MKYLSILILIFFPFVSVASISMKQDSNSNIISFNTETWIGEINPHTLEIKGGRNKSELLLISDTSVKLGKIENVSFEENEVSWYYPEHDLKTKILIKNNRLVLRFETSTEQKFIFPRTGKNEKYEALIYPSGEGLFVPQNDSFWEKQLVGTSLGTEDALTMPFWGHYSNFNTVTYILHDDLNSELQFLKEKKLYTQLEHKFRKTGDHIRPFEISIILGDKSPIQPALEYKKYLKEKGYLKNLNEKAIENPEVQKLYGAIHIYLWGTGRSLEALDRFQKLELTNLWLGYDQDPRSSNYLVTPEIIQKGVKLGYLIGPYDSFHTMQNPKNADGINNIFDDLYPAACIHDKNGKVNIGFGGKGCHVSSEAFVLQQPKNKTLYSRVNTFVKTGINSYFLDCDATGELFDDYSSMHLMTKEKDRTNRIERMAYIAADKKMVLGSETAVSWAVSSIAFAHGNFSVHNAIHWPFTKQKEYGVWWPQERPSFFFKKVNASTDYITSKYDPRYRLPLFQTVFHESIITTDRWEISHLKIGNAVKVRELLELFYGVPSIWSLDLEDIEKYGFHLKKLYSFFSPLHKAIVTEELKDFIWLDEDRKVQQIIFGNNAKLTANFSDVNFGNIPGNTLEVHWLEKDKKEYYTP